MWRWFYPVLALCIVTLTIALAWAIWAFGRAGRRAERVLALVERELVRDVPPLVASLRELTGELRALSAGVNVEVARIGRITERVEEVADSTGRLLTGLAGLTRTGQIIGIVAGIKRGVDVFVHRWRKPRRGEDSDE